MILGVDRLPSGPIQTSAALERRRQLQMLAVQELLECDRADYRELAERLSKGNPKRAKRWRQRLRTWIHEEYFQNAIAMATKGEMMLAMPGTAMALSRRAIKGNIPAAKLAMEATGVYNPRVQHEHSGDIAITIHNAPRPEPVVDVIDAEEVD